MSTTQLLEFFEHAGSMRIVRVEIHSAAFGELRHHLRWMLRVLSEDADEQSIFTTERIRSALSIWLTVPMKFNDEMLNVLTEQNPPDAVEARLGKEYRLHYDAACDAARKIADLDNPLRQELAKYLVSLRQSGRAFRIYCSRRSREIFESIADECGINQLRNDDFIHSTAEYRRVAPFQSLIKVGPLRSRGWGAVPDAVLTAPRFEELLQFVWSGCADESGFGYDPSTSLAANPDQNADTSSARDFPGLNLRWQVHKNDISDGSQEGAVSFQDADDLQVMSGLNRPADRQRAVLLQLAGKQGIFYPPQSRVLSLDRDAGTKEARFDFRVPGEALSEGMFLVLPVVDDLNLPDLQAEEGHFSRIWKEALRKKLEENPARLGDELFSAGIDLIGLYNSSRIKDWCRPATTVIPAPKEKEHFRILIKFLGCDFSRAELSGRPRSEWWLYAWDEIRRSRGLAIQAGVEEQVQQDQQLLSDLRQIELPSTDLVDCDSLELVLPDGSSFRGTVRVFRINAVEYGYHVPHEELKTLISLDDTDPWHD